MFQERRDLVVHGLNANTGLDCLTPEGAFYVFPSVKRLLGQDLRGRTKLATDEDFVMALLEETGVALVHGSAFGLAGAHAAQLCSAANKRARGCGEPDPGFLRWDQLRLRPGGYVPPG